MTDCATLNGVLIITLIWQLKTTKSLMLLGAWGLCYYLESKKMQKCMQHHSLTLAGKKHRRTAVISARL